MTIGAWVLIVWVKWGYAGGITAAYFQDQKACETAAAAMLEANMTVALCFPTSSAP